MLAKNPYQEICTWIELQMCPLPTPEIFNFQLTWDTRAESSKYGSLWEGGAADRRKNILSDTYGERTHMWYRFIRISVN